MLCDRKEEKGEQKKRKLGYSRFEKILSDHYINFNQKKFTVSCINPIFI